MTRAYAGALRAAAADLGGWSDLPFFTAGDFEAVLSHLNDDPAQIILPPADTVFAALRRTRPENVRVVILGQDPYPTPGHANGLAFSVAPDVKLPRSLSNIYKEMDSDIGAHPENGDLGIWADKGVLLLNSTLTVRAGEAGSHAKIGWSTLIDQVLMRVRDMNGIAWLLWGRHAQTKRKLIDVGRGENTLIIESVHPSPLSASRGFFGSKPFSQIEAHVGERIFG